MTQVQQSMGARIAASVQPGQATEDFEAGMADWQNWGNAQVVAGAGTSGSHALQVGTGAGGAALQVPNVVGGTTYRLTAQVRATDPAQGPTTLGVNFYDASGKPIIATHAPNVTSTSLGAFSYDVQAPANTSYALVWIWKDGSSGYAYLDDVAFAVASALPPPPPPPASNLVSNGDFEAGMASWVDWGNTQIVSDQVNSGTSALGVGTAAGGAGQMVDGIVPGTVYRFVAHAKVSDASQPVFVGVQFLDAAGAVVGTSQLSTVSTTYTTLSADATAAAGAVRALVYVWKNASSGLAYVDDVVLGVAPDTASQPLTQVGPNLVANGNFSGLSPWVNWGNTTIVGPDIKATEAQVGTGAGGFGQIVSGVVAGQTYRLTAGVQASTAGETGYLGLKFLDAAGNSLQDQIFPITSTAFTTASLQLVAPPNTTSALVYVWKDAGSGYVFVDTVTLAQMGTAPPPPPLVQLPASALQRLDADALVTHRAPSIARLVNGNYVAAWVATSGDASLVSTVWQVCYQRLDANLARVGANACVQGAQATDQSTHVFARPDGGFVIAWTIISSINGYSVFYAQRSQAFDAAGNPVGGIQDGTQQSIPASAAVLAGGGYVVVSAAVSYQPPAGVSNLSFQRYAADGTPIGSPTPVGDNGGWPGAMVVPLTGGGFAVAWVGGGGSSTVSSRAFTADGTPVGDPVLAGGVTTFCSPNGCPYQNLTGLMPMDDGGYLVSFMKGFGLGEYLGNFVRRIHPDGTPGAAVANAPWGAPAAAGADGFAMVLIADGGTGAAGQVDLQRYDATALR